MKLRKRKRRKILRERKWKKKKCKEGRGNKKNMLIIGGSSLRIKKGS